MTQTDPTRQHVHAMRRKQHAHKVLVATMQCNCTVMWFRLLSQDLAGDSAKLSSSMLLLSVLRSAQLDGLLPARARALLPARPKVRWAMLPALVKLIHRSMP